jgi:transposase
MSQKVISMLIIRTMLQLLQRSCSERTIAAELHISRNTLRKYDATFKACPYSYKELLDMDDTTLSEIVYPSTRLQANTDSTIKDPRLEAFEALRGYFTNELKRTGVTKQLLWQEYLNKHPDGYRYTQFCEHLRRFEKATDVSLHIPYKPGDTLMIDFAGDKLYYVDPCTGEQILCPVLVCVLPFSGYSYVEALPNATLPQLVKALNNCLRFMGGAPLNLISDNMRQVVTKSCRYEPVFTDMILAWAQHNSIHLKAARVRSPRDKPHVENEVKITYARIYAPLRDKIIPSTN